MIAQDCRVFILFITLLSVNLEIIRSNMFVKEEAGVERFTGKVCGTDHTQRLVQRVLLAPERMKVRNLEKCVWRCFALKHQEVVQVEEIAEGVISGPWTVLCTCSSVSARYFSIFPRRYLQCNSVINAEVRVQHFYRQDRVWTGIPMPLLFYALDEVTGTTNLGSLNEAPLGPSRSLEWINGMPHFDCSRDTGNGADTPKLLRFVPVEMPWLRVIHNISHNSIYKHFTWMHWFKKRSAASLSLPFLDAMLGANLQWVLWNYYWQNELYVEFFGDFCRVFDTFTPTTWNQLAVTVAAPDVNASQVSGHSMVSGSTVVFGDRFNIARRNIPGELNDGRVFDGCFAHIALFNKTFSVEEQLKILSLFKDKNW